MKKTTTKSAGLLLSAASLSLATLATPRLAHALEYDGDYLSGPYMATTQVGTPYTLTHNITDPSTTHRISGNNSPYPDLYSGGFNIDLFATVAFPSHLFVADYSTSCGTLTIESGSQLTTQFTTIGNQWGSQGHVTVKDPGSKWINHDSLYLGEETNGTPPPGSGNPNGASGLIKIGGGGELHSYSNIYIGENGNGHISVAEDGLLTFGSSSSSATIFVGSNSNHGLGTLRVSGSGRVQEDLSGGDNSVYFTEKATFRVTLSEGRANSTDAFVSASNFNIYQGSKLEVDADGITFNEGDGFILFSAGNILWTEGGGVPFAPDAISVYNNDQNFTLELRNSGLDLVLVAGAPIPEPSTYALIGGAGVLGLAVLCRRRSRKA
ncbi:MAG: PEP-CTERM sorting domain-containing protein [Puniceicoccales bacterium]|jgi:T5SS/PEP-CTERM-associated repeat protein|nr:PEP-CTERM sorting domain-containing protein [Puniceicoccales bacterium]